MQEYVSPRLAAAALGVSESSLKRWADAGQLAVLKTGGGHRRVSVSALLVFAREHGYEILNPEMLGLPPGELRGTPNLERAVEELAQHLLAGDETWVRRTLMGAHLAGASLASLVDSAISPAFVRLGEQWSQGDADIYEEHRASELMLRVLHELRLLVAPPPEGAPLALGASLGGDHYSLPITCAELVLREAGLRATSLGCNLPSSSLVRAMQRYHPHIVFLSITTVNDMEIFVPEYQAVWTAAEDLGAFLVVGGRAFDSDLQSRLRYSAACDSMTRLWDLARTMVPKGGVEAR